MCFQSQICLFFILLASKSVSCFLIRPSSPFSISAAADLRFAGSQTRLNVLKDPETDTSIEKENALKDLRNIQKETKSKGNLPNIVLVAGFESFNRDLYIQAASELPINLSVFADSDIRSGPARSEDDNGINPAFADAVTRADAFIGSLIFDYDDVLAVKSVLPHVKGPRLVFESATELMTFNSVGSFSMEPGEDGPSGPPPAVKAVLSKFSSGKEEDKISGYLKLLKIGPSLLKFVPGEKANDLRTWLEAYRYWNQGGKRNVGAMLKLITQRCSSSDVDELLELPELQVTPDIGLLHPLNSGPDLYFTSPASYLSWRLSPTTKKKAEENSFVLAPDTAPRVAVLLYRKHVITEQRYINDLIRIMEGQGVLPIPIFINGVEAHTIVRDMLTSQHEIDGVARGSITRDSTYQPAVAARVDAVVNTIGFPLVGGPAGSMEAGRNAEIAGTLLRNMNVPYVVASPLLLQSIPQWKTNGVLGLQSVVLYSLPELDGAVDTVVLGGLVGDKIALVPERVRKLTARVKGWVNLRRKPPSERKIAIYLYGFPPNVGAVGTAALLDVPRSLEALLKRLHKEGYDVGDFATDPDASGESIVAALSILSENPVISGGAKHMQDAVDAKIERAKQGDKTVAATLAKQGAGMGGGIVRAMDVSRDELEKKLGKYMSKKVRRAWSEKDRGPGVSSKGDFVVAGIQLGNVWVTVQPLLGVEGDPMRLLFEKDLTPHPQYCASYQFVKQEADAMVTLGTHGTCEWLPGQALGSDRQSWPDELVGALPNAYVYVANNPSESILAKRRGYGTLVSYNVPPYGRAGLYLELAALNELISDYRMESQRTENGASSEVRSSIWSSCVRSGIISDVPLYSVPGDATSLVEDSDLPENLSNEVFDSWMRDVADYLVVLQDRLFSSGLHTLGESPSTKEITSYLQAYFGDDKLSKEECSSIISSWQAAVSSDELSLSPVASFLEWLTNLFGHQETNGHSQTATDTSAESKEEGLRHSATEIVSLLSRSTEELDSVINCLDGGYVPAAPGGDLLRDGSAVLPTGRNIHALDPYRMPSMAAWARGQIAAKEIIKQHQQQHSGEYPETVAVTLWGLDAIKTKGESVAIVLALVGATPIKEGTGRIVRFDLLPLEQLGRPRIDVLASLSGIFRDSFANIVDLLDDMFERAATADEPSSMNFIKKHSSTLAETGVERTAARLFSNPPGDYGSMVNEVVGTGDWEDEASLGETWTKRNAFSYGRNEGDGGALSGTARPEVLDLLLNTTERVVQEIDSVEYGMTDIQEYYANTGALKKAAENRKALDPTTGKRKKVSISVIEAFGGPGNDSKVPVKEVEEVLRLEYRSKLLNPKWRDAMLDQGSGGAFEISQRMTAMVGWAATAEVDNFVFDQAAERYALDEEVARKLQQSNPEAFKNTIRRLLEAAGRGMWSTDDDILEKLRDLYSDADDLIEQGGLR